MVNFNSNECAKSKFLVILSSIVSLLYTLSVCVRCVEDIAGLLDAQNYLNPLYRVEMKAKKVAREEAKKVAREEAEKVAKKEAEKEAKKEAEKEAEKEADTWAEKVAEKVAKKLAEGEAKKVAKKEAE